MYYQNNIRFYNFY